MHKIKTCKVLEVEQLLKEFKNIFAWTYKDLKRIPPKLAQHKIELDTIGPLAHEVRYRLNPNYAIATKQDIDKLLTTIFIQFVEEATWLSPIIVILKKNGKLRMCIDFKKLNAATKKDPYPLPFTNEMFDTIAWYETYSLLDEYSRYHQISISKR
jgi:hypothetical protein